MKKNEIKIGHCYLAKVSDRVVTVRVDSVNSHGGWNATNTATGKRIRIKSAQRLRGRADATATAADAAANRENARLRNERAAAPDGMAASERALATSKRLSALDAAAQVLADTGQPMNAKALIAAMAERDLWTSPGGKTPEATLYAAIVREIAIKGDAARFRKVERGQFECNAAAVAGA